MLYRMNAHLSSGSPAAAFHKVITKTVEEERRGRCAGRLAGPGGTERITAYITLGVAEKGFHRGNTLSKT